MLSCVSSSNCTLFILLTCECRFVLALDYRHPALVWRRTLSDIDFWNEQDHSRFPGPLRAIIATLLILARSENPHTSMRSRGLNDVNTVSLYAMFRWIGRLNYFP